MLPDFLVPSKKESKKTRLFRWAMGFYPVIFGTGGKTVFISGDWHEVHTQLRLNMWSRNYVKTIFGGSMFSSADWQFMIMLSKILGRDYVVWDKAASIKFKRPGKETLYACFKYEENEIVAIREQVAEKGELVFNKQVFWRDKNGLVSAEIERTIYVASKSFYKAKIEARETKKRS